MYSGQTFYDPFIDTLYNILFTAYPIGWFATYDKEMNYDKLELDPKLYSLGLQNKLFNIYIFWRWYLYATSAGVIIFIYTSNIIQENSQGHQPDLWTMGAIMYLCVVFIVNFKILMATNTHNFLSVILFVFSISSYIVVMYFFTDISRFTVFGSWNFIFRNLTCILTLLLVIPSYAIFEYCWRSIHMILDNLIIKRIKQYHQAKRDKLTRHAHKSMIRDFRETDQKETDKLSSVSEKESIAIPLEENIIRQDSNRKSMIYDDNADMNTITNMKGKCMNLLTFRYRICFC
jgi:magnesium-transporting ATPase (P-type)